MPIDNDGSAVQPTFALISERSLGLYRSGASSLGLSYGQFQLPSGTSLQPSIAFSSESSLGFYRSAASTIFQSYGTFGASTYSSMNPGPFLTDIRVTSNNRIKNAAVGGKLFMDVGILAVEDGDGGSANGVVWTNDGTALRPAFAFSTEAPLGWYRSSASVMALARGAIRIQDNSALTPGYSFTSEASLGLYRSGASTMAFSYGTVNLATNAVRFSMRTLAASAVTGSAVNTNVARDEVVFTIGGASGASLIISSGGTAWIFNSAASAILA